MNTANKYVPDFVPNDLKWYERDGLLTWYDQIKCERFLEDPDRILIIQKSLISTS